MFDYKGNLRRLKLFKELEPDFKIDKVFYLIKPIEYDFKNLSTGAYIVSKPFVSSQTGDTIVTKGHNVNFFTNKAMTEGMKGWHLRKFHQKYFEDFNEKGLSSFLYWGESYE